MRMRCVGSAVVAICAMAFVPGLVGTALGNPFGIASFSMNVTAGSELVLDGPQTISGKDICQPCHVANLPYPAGFTQAGAHPWGLTTSFSFATEELQKSHELVPTRDVKDVVVDLPPGLLGNPQAVPRCSLTVVLSSREFCPADTQVGVAILKLLGNNEKAKVEVGPIVNIVPEAGQSAEFAIENLSKANFVATAHLVHTSQGYGVSVTDNGIPGVGLLEAELTFWGVPADPSHTPLRGLFCSAIAGATYCEGGSQPSGMAQVPFLSLPTSCSVGPESAIMRADSWQEPGSVEVGHEYVGYQTAVATMPGVTGCNLLKFEPGIEVQPDTLLADEPVGLGVTLTVPQVEKPAAPVTPHLRDAVVTLPSGMSVNPSVVDGIEACNESGPEGINFEGSESEERGLNGELQLAPGHCPDASIVGTAEAITPLLGVPVRGHVYLARPGCGGAGQAACTEQDAVDGNLYKLYLELGGTGEFAKVGIQIKEPGRVEVDTATGQLTGRFEGSPPKYDGNPQAPFSQLKVHLNGGPRAPIANPSACGRAVTKADLTPWSAPGTTPEGLSMPGTPDALPSSFFEVTGCSLPEPFSPGFQAGTATANAGQFSPFTLNLTRRDREQLITGISVHTPPGLLGMLSSVTLCGEPQADDGQCPASSKIGTTRVATGAGSHPFEIEGSVYLTGPHDGSPFGLSVVVPVVAGPFNLGVKVVRARIAVDRETSTLTVTTDETGPYAIPQIVFGVPVRLQHVTVNVDRPGFMFNPTNCNDMQIQAAIAGGDRTTAAVSSPFAVGACRSLAFKPAFSVSTDGRTSRARGASLDAKLSYPKGGFGLDANIASVKVSLPKQLPSRLSTLQRACPAATFEADPSACPGGSVVGIVRAGTPVLPVGLAGPVYFVSHGGEAFPSLIVVLEGDGVRVDLTGTTFISKANITSSTFKSVPDVPVNTFELYLPQGKDSALAANGSLCAAAGQTALVKRKVTRRVHGRVLHTTVKKRVAGKGLVMPTEFVAQNGLVFKQATKIAVTDCPGKRVKRARRARRSSTTIKGRKRG